MPQAEMNEAWWVRNKARTLLDYGDTVKNALREWDITKGKECPTNDYDWTAFEEYVLTLKIALGKIMGASSALIEARTTNKTAHKESVTLYCVPPCKRNRET